MALPDTDNRKFTFWLHTNTKSIKRSRSPRKSALNMTHSTCAHSRWPWTLKASNAEANYNSYFQVLAELNNQTGYRATENATRNWRQNRRRPSYEVRYGNDVWLSFSATFLSWIRAILTTRKRGVAWTLISWMTGALYELTCVRPSAIFYCSRVTKKKKSPLKLRRQLSSSWSDRLRIFFTP